MPVRRKNPWRGVTETDLLEKRVTFNSLVASEQTRKERSKAEATFQRQIERLAQMAGWYVFHIYNPTWSKAGFPDLVLIRERVVWVELKARSTTTNKRGKLSPEQETWRDMLKAAGQEWYVWWDDSPEDTAEAERVLKRC